MAGKIRIGEVLLRRDRVDPIVLSTALRDQPHGRQRLLSLLVARAQLAHDDGAMALSEQLGVPAAMERHLERRDPAFVAAIPPEVGCRWVVVPIGEARTGQLVVCARDPSPILGQALEHIVKRPILLAVALGAQIERLVRACYGEPAVSDAEVVPADLPSAQRGLELDDTPIPRRARSISDFLVDRIPELPRSRSRDFVPRPLDGVLEEIDRAVSLVAVERLAMAYASRRWRSALLVRLADGAAFGYRGHGPELGEPDAVVVPLDAPSTIRSARDTGKLAFDAPASAAQDKLARVLGAPAVIAAAPVSIDAVLAVGQPLHGENRDSLADLDRLADALGAARRRFGR